MSQIPRRRPTPGEQSSLNYLQFRWSEQYQIRFDGFTWAAIFRATEEELSAESAPLLRDLICLHHLDATIAQNRALEGR